MKRIISLILMLLLCWGCASKGSRKPGSPSEYDLSAKESFDKGIEYMKDGIDAHEDGDLEKASQAFIQASRLFRLSDEEGREVLSQASWNLRKIVSISGFEYAPKESFELLVIYLDMQNAYMDYDMERLKALEERFRDTCQRVQQTTVLAKQKHLEELGLEVTQRSEEIQKQAEAGILEVYATIYVVKKGDTLPSIAARHEIYNDSYMWPLVYKGNRDQIKDPKTIYVGQDLKIPREMTMEEIIEARREAGAPEPEKIPKDAYIPRRKK